MKYSLEAHFKSSADDLKISQFFADDRFPIAEIGDIVIMEHAQFEKGLKGKVIERRFNYLSEDGELKCHVELICDRIATSL